MSKSVFEQTMHDIHTADKEQVREWAQEVREAAQQQEQAAQQTQQTQQTQQQGK